MGDFGFQVTQRLVGQTLRARAEVESFERDPTRIIAPAQDLEYRLEIVVSSPAVAAVEFVDVDVTDAVEMPVYERGVRLPFVDGVVHVEHRLHERTADLPDNRGSFVQCLYDIRLSDGKRFHQHGHFAPAGIGHDGPE